MINSNTIDLIQKKILERVIEQVTNGQQSKLFNQQHFACGQFLDLKNKNQRGVHGSSAALRIIAGSNEDGGKNKKEIQGLISYLENRLTLEQNQISESKIKRDDTNIIKISEILYALSFVKTGVANTETYIKKIHELLDKAFVENKGWGYFLQDTKSKILPTSFAVLSLQATGYDVSNQVKYLESELTNAFKEHINDPTQFSKYVFCLFVLTYSRNTINSEDEKKYEKYFEDLVNSPVCNMAEDLEQNIEYWPESNDAEHDYIRIPWQLYLLSISVKLSPWYFSKVKCQSLLKTIQLKSLNGGFKYSHSGHYLSTRTQSIIFDCLAKIKAQLNKEFLYLFFNFLDRIIGIFKTRFFRVIIKVIISAISICAIYKWFNSTDSLKDLGPEIAGGVLFWLYALGSRNTQK